MSPEAQAALIGGMAGGVVGGVFTLLGVALGLFGERWVRNLAEVACVIEVGDRFVHQTAVRGLMNAVSRSRS
jgi:hypothetical protein